MTMSDVHLTIRARSLAFSRSGSISTSVKGWIRQSGSGIESMVSISDNLPKLMVLVAFTSENREEDRCCFYVSGPEKCLQIGWSRESVWCCDARDENALGEHVFRHLI